MALVLIYCVTSARAREQGRARVGPMASGHADSTRHHRQPSGDAGGDDIEEKSPNGRYLRVRTRRQWAGAMTNRSWCCWRNLCWHHSFAHVTCASRPCHPTLCLCPAFARRTCPLTPLSASFSLLPLFSRGRTCTARAFPSFMPFPVRLPFSCCSPAPPPSQSLQPPCSPRLVLNYRLIVCQAAWPGRLQDRVHGV